MPQTYNEILLGIDTGGTFTDFVLFQGGQFRIHKVLSTPHAPEKAILQGIAELGITRKEYSQIRIIHGTTVATNAVLERKGVRTAYITNRGMADLLSIGRQARKELYNLQPRPIEPPVPKELCLETGGRISASAEIIEPLTQNDLNKLREQIKELKPEAVAINLLFSYLDPTFEKQIEAALSDHLYITRSSAILPEYREYERGIVTWINSWIGPLVAGYLDRLRNHLPECNIAIMQSAGTTISAKMAPAEAVKMLLSGPAGGLAGAKSVAEASGFSRLLTFDMGGTSTDVALIDGDLRLSSELKIGDWPVSVPMVDMHTIGAGGGSIASIDSGGMLHVGPESAGAAPGPACYGKGGTKATVTDANLFLGRILPDQFLGGRFNLNRDAAVESINKLALQMQITSEQAAKGIIDLANTQMVRALQVISVERGEDPRQYTLVSFGGAGGLHVCALAEALEIREALVPVHSGVLSALGMLMAPPGRHLSHSIRRPLDGLTEREINILFQPMIAEGREALISEGIEASSIDSDLSFDLCYAGQAFTLNIPWEIQSGQLHKAAERFHLLHQQRYGHQMACAIELVNLRLRAHSTQYLSANLQDNNKAPPPLPTEFLP